MEEEEQSVMEEVEQRRGVTLVSEERGRVLSGFDPAVRSQGTRVSVIEHGEGWSSLEVLGCLDAPLHHLKHSLCSPQALGVGSLQAADCSRHPLVGRLIAPLHL